MIRPITAPDGRLCWVPEAPNLVTTELEAGKYWEPSLLPLFPLCCRPNRWTVEVGAYIGDHTIALLQHGPVLAIEPQPLPWALLGLNLAVRSFSHPWSTRRQALYSRVATLDHAPGWAPDHPSNGYQPGAPCGLFACPFDDGPEAVLPTGFWKIDAKGCDLQVLKGAERTLARDRPIILCEFEPSLAQLHGDDADSYRGWFSQREYEIRGIGGGNILAVPRAIDPAPYWRAITDQGIELTT